MNISLKFVALFIGVASYYGCFMLLRSLFSYACFGCNSDSGRTADYSGNSDFGIEFNRSDQLVNVKFVFIPKNELLHFSDRLVMREAL